MAYGSLSRERTFLISCTLMAMLERAVALDDLLGKADRFPDATWAELQSILSENALYDGSFGPGNRRAVLA